MPRVLILIAGWLLESAIKKLLLGAGLAVVSMAVIQTYFDRYLQKAINQTGSMDNWILGLIALAKLDVCMSIIIGAVVARVAISSASLSLRKS